MPAASVDAAHDARMKHLESMLEEQCVVHPDSAKCEHESSPSPEMVEATIGYYPLWAKTLCRMKLAKPVDFVGLDSEVETKAQAEGAEAVAYQMHALHVGSLFGYVRVTDYNIHGPVHSCVCRSAGVLNP